MFVSRFTKTASVSKRRPNIIDKHFNRTYNQFPSIKSTKQSQYNHSWRVYAGATVVASVIVAHQILSADEEKNTSTKVGTPTFRELKSPKELFKYYSSIENNGEVLMTTQDFIRFIIPNSEINEALTKQDGLTCEQKANLSLLNNIFNSIDLNNDGLICFSEFMFFVTLLSIPPKYFKLAFRLFDEDRSGSVDKKEFNKILRLVQHANPLSGSKRRSSHVGRKDEDEDEDDEGVNYPVFFGLDGKKQLSYPEFEKFILQLRDKMNLLDFSLLSKGRNSIPARDYAINLVSYLDPRIKHDYDKRIESLASSDIEIVLEEHKTFNLMLESLDDIDFALRSFVALGQPFTKNELRRAASAASTAKLSDNLLNLIFELFDKNGDGKLDAQEFVGALQSKQSFGFTKPRDKGIVRAAKCTKYCWSEEIYCRYAKPV